MSRRQTNAFERPRPGWPLHIRHRDRTLAFFTTVAAFGTPLDITVSELVIESFFSADEPTAGRLGATRRGRPPRRAGRAGAPHRPHAG